MVTENISGPIDCACVIHGDAYSWDYVERLYSMLSRHLSQGVRLHVYTEENRPVPEPFIKHALDDWKISGPKRSWWYKIQLFDATKFSGSLLYFDLDTVIVSNIDWIPQLSLEYFWTVRDFKFLWQPVSQTANTSIMWFDTNKFNYVYKNFKIVDINQTLAKYRGDQDYVTDAISPTYRRFFDQNRVKSWRWQCLDGGYNFDKKKHINPGTGTELADMTSILVCHGKPKPSETTDPTIVQHWK